MIELSDRLITYISVSDERAIDPFLGMINERAIDLFLVIKGQVWSGTMEVVPRRFQSDLRPREATQQDISQAQTAVRCEEQSDTCTGRQRQYLTYQEQDALVLLPPEHYLTEVLLRHIHKHETGHLGINAMTITVKVDYWLPRHVQIIRKILDRCVPYQRQNASAFDEFPADLPGQRLRIEDPFSVTGLDFAGPFVRNRAFARLRRRRHQATPSNI